VSKKPVKTKPTLDEVLEEEIEALALEDPSFDKAEAGKKLVDLTTTFELHIGTPGFKKSIDSAHFMRVVSKLSEDEIASLTPEMKKLISDAQTQIGVQEFPKKVVGAMPGLEEDSNGHKPDPSMVHVSQDLIDRKFIKAIAKRDKQFTNYVKAHVVPSPLKFQGAYLMRRTEVKMITDAAKQYIEDREKLITLFGKKWDAVVKDAKTKRGPFFTSADYPPFATIRLKYDVEYRWINYNVAAALSDLDSEIYKEESEKAGVFFANAAQEARDAARIAFQELNDHLLSQLGTDEKGKPKRFMGGSITKYVEFINMFLTGGDLTGDNDLKKFCLKAKDILQNVDPAEVRKDTTLRETIFDAVNTIKKDAGKLIVVSQRKFFKGDEDEPTEALSLD